MVLFSSLPPFHTLEGGWISGIISHLVSEVNIIKTLFFSSKEQASFNFMAAVTICSDFGAQENKIYYCFYFFPILEEKVWQT